MTLARATTFYRQAMPRQTRFRRRQRGAVLIFGLVVLLVVTMVGISGQQGTVLQERLAGNMRQNQIALQAAEAALQAGLSYVEEQDLPIDATASGTYFVWNSCTVADAAAAEQNTNSPCTRLDTILSDWQRDPAQVSQGATYAAVAAATDAGYGGPIPGVAAQPRLYIEVREEPSSPDAQANSFGQMVTYFYTVTAVGFGGNEQARAIVQSTIAKQVYQ